MLVQVLSDAQKRAAYDQFGPAAFGGAQGGPGPEGFGGFAGNHEGFQGFDPNDIFNTIFGGGFARAGGRGGFRSTAAGSFESGEDILVSMTVPFMEAVHGATRTVTVERLTHCLTCNGSGLAAGATASTCRACNGTGSQVFSQGMFQMATTCRVCGGEGKTVAQKDRCGSCRGSGRVRERKDIQVDIPAGIDDEMRIKISGEGNAPESGRGAAGDLYVQLRILPSPIFKRQGADVYVDAQIPFYQAILGGKVKVPTLDGEVELKVPAGTQPGDSVVMRKKGIAKLKRKERGDQYVTLKVKLPTYPMLIGLR